MRHRYVALPVWEQTTYWLLGLSILFYSVFRVYINSQEFKPALPFLGEGWSFLGDRQLDLTEGEWGIYSADVIWRALSCIAGHEAAWQTMRQCGLGPRGRKFLLLVTGVVCMHLAISWRFVVMSLVIFVVIYIVSLLQSILGVWVTSLCTILVCNTEWATYLLVDLMAIQTYGDYFLFTTILGFAIFKSLAFASERIWFLSRQDNLPAEVVRPDMQGERQPSPCLGTQSPTSSDCLTVTSADLPPETSADLPPVTSADLPPVTSADLPPVTSADLPPVTSADLPPVTSADLPPVTSEDLPPGVSSPGDSSSDGLARTACRSRSVTDRAPRVHSDTPPSAGETNPPTGTESGSMHERTTLTKCPDLVDGLTYLFYMPFAIPGLVVPCHFFLAHVEKPAPMTSALVTQAAWRLVRMAFWFCLNGLMLHFLYFNAMATSGDEFLGRVDKWTLAGIAYLLGQFMTSKYTVFYGLPLQVAKLDGLYSPEPPACISYIYLYSDMWRHFDVGMYECVNRYLFRPIRGSKAGQLRHLSALFLTFTFLGLWHNGTNRLMLWSSLNFLAIVLEMLGARLETAPFVKEHVVRRLSPVAMQRVRAAVMVPHTMMSTTTQAVFLGNTTLAKTLVSRIVLEADSLLVSALGIFCFIHISQHLQRLGWTKLKR